MPSYPLTRSETPLIADVVMDDLTAAALAPFDLDPEVVSKFYPWQVPEELPRFDAFGIGLIVGASGSGKSQLLRHFGEPTEPEWEPRRTIASHFRTAEEAAERFYAVGLNTVPVWRLPYDVLSNGQKFRADLARTAEDLAVVDEFTSVVDRNVAASASKALRTYVDRRDVRGLVLASCHRDVIPWLRPDWVIDTDAGIFTVGETVAAPKWYAEHLTGDAVGRLTLKHDDAAQPAASDAVPEAASEPLAVSEPEPKPSDPILAEIAAATSYEQLRGIYVSHFVAGRWKRKHTNAAGARRAELEGAS